MAAIPTPVFGVPYSFQLTAIGAVPPVTWTLSAGSLPDNLTLSSSGLISGTPVETGTFSPTFKGVDALSNVVYISCTFILAAPCNLAHVDITINPGDNPVDVLLDETFMYMSYAGGSGITIEKRSQTTAALIATITLPIFLDVETGGAMAADDDYIYVAAHSFENATQRQYLSIIRIDKATFTFVDRTGIIDEIGGLASSYGHERCLVANGYVYTSGYRLSGGPRFADGFISQTLASTLAGTTIRDFAQNEEVGSRGVWKADSTYLFVHCPAPASATDNILYRFDLGAINNPESSVTMITPAGYYGQQLGMDDDFCYPIRSGATTNYISKVTKNPLALNSGPTLLGAGSGARCWGASSDGTYVYIYGSRTTSETQSMITRVPFADLTLFDIYYCYGGDPITLIYGTTYAPFITDAGVLVVFGNSGPISVRFLPGFYAQ